MTDLPYNSIEQNSTDITTTNSLARLIDGLGFRYRWATEELTENEINFRPVEGSMNMFELVSHIYDISTYIRKVFEDTPKPDNKPESFDDLRKATLNNCASLSKYLQNITDEELINSNPKRYWYMINGPIADALTHVGQITSWRRIAGNPQPAGVNVFFGTKS